MITIKKYARILEHMSTLFAFLFVLLTTFKWIFGIALQETDSSLNLSSMPLSDRLLGLAVESIGLLILCKALVVFAHIMKRFQTDELFSPTIAQHLNTLSKVALCWALYNPLRGMLLSVVTTLHKGPGNRILSLSIGTDDFINIFIFSCFVLITALIKEGNKVQQEHDLTV